jgi:hypothetical protein
VGQVLASLPAAGEGKTADQKALNLAQGGILTFLPTIFKLFLHNKNNALRGNYARPSVIQAFIAVNI